MPIMMPDGTDRELPEREATPDEAYQLGKSAGYSEGWIHAVEQILAWLHDHDAAAPMWEWADSYAHDIQAAFGSVAVEVARPEAGR